MSKGLALLVGIKDGGACAGAENDVDNLYKILQPMGYEIRTLKTARATRNNILAYLNYAAVTLEPDDIFVFYIASHGGQQPNMNGDWEPDKKDETIITIDGRIVDDELNDIFMKMKTGVRVFMISDTCNAGTNYRNVGRDHLVEPSPFFPIRETDRRTGMNAQIIHMGGCIDGNKSFADPDNAAEGGEFTLAICKAWENGFFQGNYLDFYARIKTFIRTTQAPTYGEYGPVSDQFRNQQPFQITRITTSVPDTPSTDPLVTETSSRLQARVKSGRINVRSGPGVEYPDIGDLFEGDVVDILSIDGEDAWIEFKPGKWAAVSYKGSRFMKVESKS